MEDSGERIAKYLASAGIASRRDVEKLIAEGRVTVDGQKLDTPAFKVTGREKITVDGQPVRRPDVTRLWRYHKPAGLVTTNRDPEGRPTIFDHLPKHLPRTVTIGRLDLNTEGLLLLTNDGELARGLELPATGLKRKYRARAYGRAQQKDLDRLRDGIVYDGVEYRSIIATLDRVTGSNSWIDLTLVEGKKREARRALESLGLKVNRLIRISYGPIELGDLPEGEVDEIPPADLLAEFAALIPERRRPSPFRDVGPKREKPRGQARPEQKPGQRPEHRKDERKPAPKSGRRHEHILDQFGDKRSEKRERPPGRSQGRPQGRPEGRRDRPHSGPPKGGRR